TPDEAQREYLDTMAQSAPSENYTPGLRQGDIGARTRERVLGMELSLLAAQAGRPERPLLTRAVTELGDGALARGVAPLEQAALTLTSDDDEEIARAERYAVELGRRAAGPGGLLSEALRQDLAVTVAQRAPSEVLTRIEPSVAERHAAVDVSQVRQAANELAA